jgi:hypothetical protein
MAKAANKVRTFDESLKLLVHRLEKLREGDASLAQPCELVFQLSGKAPGTYKVQLGSVGKPAQFGRERGLSRPDIEVNGASEAIQAILDGKKEPLKAFLGGGIRVRGNIPLLEHALERLHLLRIGR